MKAYFSHITLLLKRITLLLILLQLSRVFFLAFNFLNFQDNSVFEFFRIFAFGSVYDISAILLFNIIFVIFSILPFNFISNNKYQAVLKYLFIFVSSLLLITNFTDIEYFKFTNKRTTYDVFSLIFMGNDTAMILPQFLKDFWYIIVIWFVFVFLLIKFYPKKNIVFHKRLNLKNGMLRLILMLLIITLTAFLIRGFGLRPLAINGFAKYTKTQNIPLIINTPFSIIRTLNRTGIKEKHYFESSELIKYVNPIKQFKSDSSFTKKNVVIIILESFGSNYTGTYYDKLYTPFLDSLIGKSLYSQYSYSNGKTSMQGMSAIISSIPNLSDRPFITSLYSANEITGLPKILKKEGYYSAFFHGGQNGTMGFDNFAYSAGFNDYFGKNEYDNNDDYDGKWGIYDEEFLKYFSNKMSEFKQPFITSVFTLSSHHPYNVPEKYKNKFKGGELPIYRAVEYSDYSLQQFFEAAKKTDWYENTIFVLTADHTSSANTQFFWNRVGQFRIPIFFYTPNNSLKRNTNSIIQQIDIMPTILDYLNFKKPFYSLGNSVISGDESFAVNYLSGIYQLFDDKYVYLFDGDNGVGMYNTHSDSLLQHNLLNKEKGISNEMNNKIKAIIQTYNRSLINNKMTIDNYNKKDK